MKTISKHFILFLSLLFVAVSCSNDDDNDGNNNANSREIKYEVTGNFSGDLSATYITAGGGGANEDILSLPWIKEFTAASQTSGVTLTVGGTGGVPGQTITLKIYAGGVVKRNESFTANSDGTIVGTSGSYVL